MALGKSRLDLDFHLPTIFLIFCFLDPNFAETRYFDEAKLTSISNMGQIFQDCSTTRIAHLLLL